ncbi:DUF456 domain-containing protein [Thermodesulfobacteriota bacterium]
MQTAGAVLFVLVLLVGLISIVFGLPGTLIILGTTVLYAWITGFAEIGWWVILGMAGIAIVAEGTEFLVGYFGAKKFGTSRKGALFSILGGFVGAVLMAPLFFGVGAIFGALLGTFIGAFVGERREGRGLEGASRGGFGATFARLLGMATKVSLAIVMIIIVVIALFPF